MTALLWLLPAGLLLGTLINYLADVLPAQHRLARPACVFCEQKLNWRDYLLLRPCPQCGRTRLARAWLLPVLYAALLAWLWFYPPKYLTFWEASVLLVFFGLVVVVDIEHRIILHAVNGMGALIGLWIGVAHRGWVETLLGGLAGFGAMLLFYYIGIWYARFLARRSGQTVEDDEALGFGDVFLGGVIGLLLGWPAVAAGLFAGILSAGLVGGGILVFSLLRKRYDALASIPYGPFLVFGAILILYMPW